jgi:hypothetical protein
LLLLSGDRYQPSRHQFRPAFFDRQSLTTIHILNIKAREASRFPGLFVLTASLSH